MGFYLIGPLVILILLGSISSWDFKPYCDDGLLGISPTPGSSSETLTSHVLWKTRIPTCSITLKPIPSTPA
jgi:hypothetical protein